MSPAALSPAEARAHLLGHLGLRRRMHSSCLDVLRALGCIQLDPLDPIGTNADLVVMARTDEAARGDVYREVYADAFEHFAKERCILPSRAFPIYAAEALRRPTWRLTSRLRRVGPEVLDAVHGEVAERGPLSASKLRDHGRVEPIDWGGWKSTNRAGSMALQVLALQCRLVVSGRRGRQKIYDTPERALGAAARTRDEATPFLRWALRERVRSAALLGCRAGASWSTVREAKPLVDVMINAGELDEVGLAGSRTRFLVLPGTLDTAHPEDDSQLKIIGPLDPLVWDRRLLFEAFGFEYTWEVYKPEAQRRFAWYVMPLLHQGALVGRLAGMVSGGTLVIEHLWRERSPIDLGALDETLADHAARLGCDHFVRPTRARANP